MSAEIPVVDLNWEGPLEPAAMDLGFAGLERLERPGVYVCLYDYPEGDCARLYVGVTRNFRQRLREHLVATLGLAYRLADDSGAIVYGVDHRDHLFEAAQDLERHHRLAVAEVRRMRWYHALDDSDPYIPWPMFEGVLIQHVRGLQQADRRTHGGRRVLCYNERGGLLPDAPMALRNRGAEEIVDLLGETVAWPREEAAA